MIVREQTKNNMRKVFSYGDEVTELIKNMYSILNNPNEEEELREYLEEIFYSDDFEYINDYYEEVKRGSSILKRSIIECYMIDTGKIKRLATKNEVEQGVKDIDINEIFVCKDERLFRIMCFVYGVQKGDVYLLKRAGLGKYISYNTFGNAIIDYRGIIKNERELINNSISTCKERRINEDIEAINKEISKIKIVYPDKAMSEVTESIDINTIIFNVKNKFPYNSDNKSIKRARAIVFNAEKYKKEIALRDKQYLREVYSEYCEKVGKDNNESVNLEIKDACELAERLKIDGLIDSNSFCFKIIDTLKQKGYKYWSEKQKAIIMEAIGKANESKEKEEFEEFNDIDTSCEKEEEDIFKIGCI